MTNIILETDSYKLNHWNQYPKDTQAVYSYFESRVGARFPYTVFFGLQAILKEYLVGQAVSWDDLSQASELSRAHFGGPGFFNYAGWAHLLEHHGGRLPLRIKAVPEGTPVPTGNVLMTVENTDPKCFWLTNAVESLLTHVWYPSTVATLSHHTKAMMATYLEDTAMDMSALPFMLHDFGYRGASSPESAALGGAAHLLNSLGTDTLPGMLAAMKYYGADLDGLAYSVPATEHSVMTALGREGEGEVVDQLLEEYPTGILSVVADSYDIYRFVHKMGTAYKERILERDGTFVVRPDSTTADTTPEGLVAWIADQLWHDFRGTVNAKGYKVLDPHVKILWGDGIDPTGIERILEELRFHSFSAENIVFGMGGGLLQKVNRDTQRFAFKASAIRRDGTWHDISKEPLDSTKRSKAGRLRLIRNGEFQTITAAEGGWEHDLLETVFENGNLVESYTFNEVRANAGSLAPAAA